MGKTVIREYTINTGGRLRLTAAFISDIHERHSDRLIALIREIKPDVIFIGGDLIEAKTPRRRGVVSGSVNAYRFLKEAVSIAPVYYGLGNHEKYVSDEKKRRAVDTGAILLENTYRSVAFGDKKFIIGAVAPAEKTAWLSLFSDEIGYKILICHEPERYIDQLMHINADLVLSGHAHGGQWRFFGHGIYSPGQGILPKYTRGIYGRMLVSAGAANHTPVPRIFNPTEVVKINFI